MEADQTAATGQHHSTARGWSVLIALLVVAVGGFLLAMAMPEPQARQYPDRIPVRFWHMWSAEWKVVVDQIVEQFNESQDKYEVIALSVPATGGADSKFVLSVAGGDPPDVMAQWNPVIPNWAESGLLQPLDELMTPREWEQLREQMYPIARKIGMYEGHLYGVTVGLNVWAVYYRPDHVRAAGLDPDQLPQTLEGLFAWGEKLDKFDEDGNLIRLGFLPQGLGQYAPYFGDGFYDWGAGELRIVTPDNLRAVRYMTEQRARLGYEQVERFLAGTNQESAAGGWPFISGAYSITIEGQWRVEQIGRYAPGLDYRTAPVPPPAGGRELAGFSNGNFMIIPRGAREPAGAWEFIKFWSGIEQPERAAEFYTWGGWLPLTPAVAQAPVYQEYLRKYPQFRTFVEMLPSENIQTTAPVPYTIYLNDRVLRADDVAMRGIMAPEQALEQLERDVEREVARRREFGYDD